MKSAIVATIPDIKEDRALEVYKDLMQQSPPLTSTDYMWELMSPFRDSLQFTLNNLKLFKSLIEFEPYRSSIL